MSFVKYRLKEVATDFGTTPKEIADIIGKFGERPKSNTQVLTDAAMAAAFVKALPDAAKYADVAAKLDEKAAKLKQRKDEAKAHQRNVRMGKKK